jgi:5-methylcytosine-specific restriction endonuclease McrA
MSSHRKEFTKATKKKAWDRSAGFCEGSGPFYNRGWDDRCNKVLTKVEYDHFIRAADGGDNSLDNCRAVCVDCHAWKTRKIDTPGAAKAKRIIRANGPLEQRRKKIKIPAPAKTVWPKRKFGQ